MQNSAKEHVTTGLPGVDAILDDLRMGDNVVWRVDDVADYRAFAEPFVAAAREAGRRVVSIRFGKHAPLVEQAEGTAVYDLDAQWGFEAFTVRLHRILAEEGPGVCYVFDCLSDLLDAWATDAMIGHFFRVTCPYLYRLDTVAYFAVLRASHSRETIARIRATTQVLIDLHRCDGELYLHPMKVDGRSSLTMFLPHRQVGAEFRPLTSSVEATSLISRLEQTHGGRDATRLDHWDRLFLAAGQLDREADPDHPARTVMIDQLCRALIGREERMLTLARRHFRLEDLLAIRSRLIGTGYIGGKAVGMLLARRILADDAERDWSDALERHDSWHVGSDVFHSILVDNGWWSLLTEHRTAEGYYPAGARLRENLLDAQFPAAMKEEFQDLLEHFGQYPIIVRSSSLQEDGFGGAFAGKYDSVFLVSQGSPEQRLDQFLTAVRTVYASAMSEEALAYRRARGLDGQEEQMALLVQRVSGAQHGRYFFPTLAGVGVSFNTFVWDSRIDPAAGMLRLVHGLGTRAVDRVPGDYPRVVALDHPELVPHARADDFARFSQRRVDVLDIGRNTTGTVSLAEVVEDPGAVPLRLLVEPDRQAAERAAERGVRATPRWILTFAGLLGQTTFPDTMRAMVTTLERAYGYPVDMEFTADVAVDGAVRVNVVQCRPLQTRGIQAARVEIPSDVPDDRVLFRSSGGFMGGSIVQPLDRVIVVDPAGYERSSRSDKHEVARLIGRLTRIHASSDLRVALLGPGRWGTSDANLGVPVSFAELRNVAVLGEVAFSAGGLMPELSFGSHFFQDLVESGIFYVALPEQDGTRVELGLLDRFPNLLAELLPGDARLADVVRVTDLAPSERLLLQADIVSQQLLCSLTTPTV